MFLAEEHIYDHSARLQRERPICRRNLININNINIPSLSGHKINGLKANSVCWALIFVLSIRLVTFMYALKPDKQFLERFHHYFPKIKIIFSYSCRYPDRIATKAFQKKRCLCISDHNNLICICSTIDFSGAGQGRLKGTFKRPRRRRKMTKQNLLMLVSSTYTPSFTNVIGCCTRFYPKNKLFEFFWIVFK